MLLKNKTLIAIVMLSSSSLVQANAKADAVFLDLVKLGHRDLAVGLYAKQDAMGDKIRGGNTKYNETFTDSTIQADTAGAIAFQKALIAAGTDANGQKAVLLSLFKDDGQPGKAAVRKLYGDDKGKVAGVIAALS